MPHNPNLCSVCASSHAHRETIDVAVVAAAEAFLAHKDYAYRIAFAAANNQIQVNQMARSFCSQANLALAFVDLLSSPLIHRRGYAVVSDGSVRGGFDRIGSRGGMVVGKVEENGVTKTGSEASSAWAPDPVTGYYRPINHMNEIDPVELRRMLLNPKLRSSSSP